jgi:histone H3/H4
VTIGRDDVSIVILIHVMRWLTSVSLTCSRIMKKVLPDHAKMSKEAKAALQECVSEFIGFITSEASDRLMEEKRKTITGDDSQSRRSTPQRESSSSSSCIRILLSIDRAHSLCSYGRRFPCQSSTACARWVSTVTWSSS